MAFHVKLALAPERPSLATSTAEAVERDAFPGARECRIVLLAGKVRVADRVGHHDYLGGCRLLADLLEQTSGVRAVVVRDGWPDDESLLEGARAIVLYNAGGDKQAHLASPERIERIQRLIDDGAGMVVIHRAVHPPRELAEKATAWLGGAHVSGRSGRGHWWTRHWRLPPHPVTRGVEPWTIRDGWLNGIQFAPGMRGVTPLVWAGRWRRGSDQGGERDVVAWSYEGVGARAFAFTGLDAHSAWSKHGVRQLVVNGILWAAGLPIPESGASCVTTAREIESHLTPREPRRWGRRMQKVLRRAHGEGMR